MEDKEMIKKKAEFYKEKQQKVHITLVQDAGGRFYNGLIKSIGTDFLIIDDFKLGDMMILFGEIENIVPYANREEEKAERSFYQP